MPRKNTHSQPWLDALKNVVENALTAGVDPGDIRDVVASATGSAEERELPELPELAAAETPTAADMPVPAASELPEPAAAPELTEDDILAALDGEANEAVLTQVRPQEMTLFIKREDGYTMNQTDARAALNMVLQSLVDVVGPLNPDAPVEDEDDESLYTVVLHATASSDLSRLGAGADGFNASRLLVGVGKVTITSRVGDIADLDLAAELGMAPLELPDVPAGQHPINGVLTLIEEQTGQRPAAQPVFRVRYTRNDGQPLTDAHIEEILNHPVSAQLNRFGKVQSIGSVRGESDAERVALIGLLEPGEIDLAAVAVGASAYRGTFDFGGEIGSVTANGEAELANADVFA